MCGFLIIFKKVTDVAVSHASLKNCIIFEPIFFLRVTLHCLHIVQIRRYFLILNFRRVLIVVSFLLGKSPASVY